MVAKLLLAVQGAHRRATDPAAAAALADIYDDVRDGLNFRKTAAAYGAFPTDPYSHTPRHRGAQQPGMTGQVKEQILARLGELGVEVVAGRLRFQPRLLNVREFAGEASAFCSVGPDGVESPINLSAGSLAFTYCQIPIIYRPDGDASIELERADGRVEHVAGAELGREASGAIFERRGTYSLLSVTLPPDTLRR